MQEIKEFLREVYNQLKEEEKKLLLEKEEELKLPIFELLNVLNLIPYDKQVDIIFDLAKKKNINVKKGIPKNLIKKDIVLIKDEEIIDRIIVEEKDVVSYFVIRPPNPRGVLYIVSFEDFQRIIDNLDLENKQIKTVSFEKILVDALRKKVSDIHIKPSRDFYYVFFRENKEFVLQKDYTMTIHQGRTLLQNLKNYAHQYTKGSFQADITSKVQDARAKYPNLNASVRLVFMPLPNLEDEYVVARILREQSIVVGQSLTNLGYLEEDIEVFEDVLKRRGGIVVISGMTNSGKSTLVSAWLANIKNKNIITVENPVEYIIGNPNVSQHQIFETDVEELKSTFVDFAKGIKRSDGDIVFLGEWRNDKELSEIIEELSFAGQLIFTTLHINSAFVYFDSVESMYKVPKKTLVETLIMSLNQSLVRKVCHNCALRFNGKESIEYLIKTKEFTSYSLKNLPFFNLDEVLNQIKMLDEVLVINKDGCEICNFRGFIGLTPVYEYFYPTIDFKDFILKQSPTPAEIEKKAIEELIGKNKLQVFIQKLKKKEVALNEIIYLR